MNYSEAVNMASSAEVRAEAAEIEESLREEFPEWRNFIEVVPVAVFRYSESEVRFRVSVLPRQLWVASNDTSAYGHIVNHEALNGLSKGFLRDETMDVIRAWTSMAVVAPFNYPDPKLS